ncbi:SWIM zinc finger family protein [Actinopolymorpha alba]|uniref:SWIM zinc finger family protein n=1 Tax=Actinopolymorpha alba TaxID=533267 RepID=UPI0003718CD7|nr:SWIM zinc finger family protein [Actinopolymorpha alba]
MSPAGRRTSGDWWSDETEENHRPPAARGRGSRRGFGQTWWGRAWVDALEHRAALDPGRLSRGRSYARRGAVGQMDVAPGLVMAAVQGSRAVPYTVTVRVPRFRRDDWERVLDAIAAQIGRTAALLDGELPPEVVSDVAAAGLDLLPGAGEIQPRCSCPDWGDPCKHAAAVCYLVADALDKDPFTLLRLRGKSRADVLSALRARRTPGPGSSAGPSAGLAGSSAEGVVARDAYAGASEPRPELPAPPLPPERPGHPVTVAFDPPPESGIDPEVLRALATAAAHRAWQLATATPGDPDHEGEADA